MKGITERKNKHMTLEDRLEIQEWTIVNKVDKRNHEKK